MLLQGCAARWPSRKGLLVLQTFPLHLLVVQLLRELWCVHWGVAVSLAGMPVACNLRAGIIETRREGAWSGHKLMGCTRVPCPRVFICRTAMVTSYCQLMHCAELLLPSLRGCVHAALY